MLHRISLIALYSLTIAFSIYLSVVGWEYYGALTVERPHHEMHEVLKPSGFIGHGVGIIGSALMLILLLYSLRKRWRPMQNWGNIRYWLNYHIWMGVTGPVLVIFHTTFKFGGIVAVSFWSMIAVALSGVLGRYLYQQIPRSVSGHELTAADLREIEEDLQERIIEQAQGNDRVLAVIQRFLRSDEAEAEKKSGLAGRVAQDFVAPFRYRALRAELRRESAVASHVVHELISLTKRRSKLHRRIAFLNTARRLLHHWHVFHKPFAIIMILIMIVHVIVAVSFGYTWIF